MLCVLDPRCTLPIPVCTLGSMLNFQFSILNYRLSVQHCCAPIAEPCIRSWISVDILQSDSHQSKICGRVVDIPYLGAHLYVWRFWFYLHYVFWLPGLIFFNVFVLFVIEGNLGMDRPSCVTHNSTLRGFGQRSWSWGDWTRQQLSVRQCALQSSQRCSAEWQACYFKNIECSMLIEPCANCTEHSNEHDANGELGINRTSLKLCICIKAMNHGRPQRKFVWRVESLEL